MEIPDSVDAHIDERYDEFLADLETLVAQPSVSGTGEGVAECAELLESMCLDYGFDSAEIVETSGHPAVIAHAYVDNDPDNDATDVLVYGHYDVQPVDREAWETPPFEPVRRDIDGEEYLFGRGTVDNKGQHFAYLAAVATLRETTGLPVNVTLLLDGEEESGSPNLLDAVEAREAELAADVSINSDGPVDETGRPTVVLGNRGILVAEVDVSGPKGDLHSGHYGGAAPNPAWELVRLLDTMKDDDGRIAIDGYYEGVEPPTEEELSILEELAPDRETLLAKLDVGGLQDGPGETFLQKTLFYPTLNINGLASGHAEEGYKTIVPADASVSIDMRLAPGQDPDDVFEKFRAHVETHAHDRVETTVTRHASLDPTRTPVDSPYREPIEAAVADGWGEAPILKPITGGSAPYALFTNYLDLPHVSVPYGQQDNNQHSSDEHYSLDHFEKGIRTSTRLLTAIADVR